MDGGGDQSGGAYTGSRHGEEAVETVIGSKKYRMTPVELKEAYARMDSLESMAELEDEIVATTWWERFRFRALERRIWITPDGRMDYSVDC